MAGKNRPIISLGRTDEVSQTAAYDVSALAQGVKHLGQRVGSHDEEIKKTSELVSLGFNVLLITVAGIVIAVVISYISAATEKERTYLDLIKEVAKLEAQASQKCPYVSNN